MKKQYEAPVMQVLLLQSKDIITASEQSFDIKVSFDALFGSTL